MGNVFISLVCSLFGFTCFSYEVHSKRRYGNKTQNEREKLKYKLKKETKVNNFRLLDNMVLLGILFQR